MARILIIEDDPDVRQVLRLMLERAGHEVLDVQNGEEGLACYRRESIDVVITDIIMPEKEGIETIKELMNDFSDARIIAISGGGTHVSPDLALKMAKMLGASYAFSKPIEMNVLLEAVEDLCR